MSTTRIAEPRTLFDPEPGSIYLDAATYGLPPRPTIEALERALRRWQEGSADFVPEWDDIAEECRALFAQLVGSTADETSLVPTASAGIGQVAASLPEGTEVVIADDEFTSVLLPFLAAAESRGAKVRRVGFTDLAEAIRPGTGIVAVSYVRSQDGGVADLASIIAAAQRVGAQVLVDATHAVPMMPVQQHIAGIDYLVAHGYKHMLCPRGVGFMHVRRDRIAGIAPYFANWRSAHRPYGGDLTLPDTAERFDLSLAWHSWVGALPSMRLLVEWMLDGAYDQPMRQARHLAELLGYPATGSSIISVPVSDADAVARALAESGIRCAARAGKVRLSTHVWNTDDDIVRAAEVVGRYLA